MRFMLYTVGLRFAAVAGIPHRLRRSNGNQCDDKMTVTNNLLVLFGSQVGNIAQTYCDYVSLLLPRVYCIL